MRIAPVRTGHKAGDIKNARKILKQEIDHPSRTVMVIRGNDDDVALFADKVATRSDVFPWREAVWLKVRKANLDKILTVAQRKWFHGHPGACAVLLDFNDKPYAWFKTDATHFEIDQAYWNAGD